MNFEFTQNQLDQIQTFIDQGALPGTNFSDAYQYISDLLEEASELPKELSVANLWLQGAAQANSGNGPFADLIWQYTAQQLTMRDLSNKIPDIQEASNQVAINLLNDILDRGVIALDPQQIRIKDASAIKQVLYSGIPSDTAYINDAGWSGALLFSGLGLDETWRLLGRNDTATLDKLDDIKNVLFAYNALNYSANYVLDQTLSGNYSIASVWDSFNIWLELPESLRSTSFVAYSTKDQIVGPAMGYVENIGAENLLDMLRRAYLGTAVNETTKENFNTNAAEFFGGINAVEQQEMDIEWLGSYSQQELELLAISSEKYRNALVALSVFAIDLDDYTGRELELFSPETGIGSLTTKWVSDRAHMFERMIEGMILEA
ncbi:hypothetical protein MNBD_GAMMA16-2328, partial [hydrothermal vent metagenome]